MKFHDAPQEHRDILHHWCGSNLDPIIIEDRAVNWKLYDMRRLTTQDVFLPHLVPNAVKLIVAES